MYFSVLKGWIYVYMDTRAERERVVIITTSSETSPRISRLS